MKIDLFYIVISNRLKGKKSVRRMCSSSKGVRKKDFFWIKEDENCLLFTRRKLDIRLTQISEFDPFFLLKVSWLGTLNTT